MLLHAAFIGSAQSETRFFLYEDSSGSLSAEKVLANYQTGKFTEIKGGWKNIGFTRSIFWMVVDQKEADHGLVINIGDHHINRISFYKYDDSGVKKTFETGDYYPFSQRPVQARGYYFPVVQGLYLVRIDKARESLQLSYRLLSLTDALQRESGESLTVALLSGMVIILIVFSLFLFAISRDPVYLFYPLYLASGWLWVLAQGGYGFQYIWPDAAWFASKARPIFSMSTIALSTSYMLLYIGGSRSGIIKKSFFGLSLFLYACIIAVLFLNDRGYQSDWWLGIQEALPVVILAYLVCSLCLLITQSLKGNRLALFYLVAISVLIISIVLQLGLYTGNVGQVSWFGRFGVSLGYITESIILMAGLVYRFNSYRLERLKLLEEINRKQEENTKVILRVQEEERSQIANQLHDVAGSLLSATRLNLSSVIESGNLTKEVEVKIRKSEEAVSEVSDTVRNLSHALSPLMLDKVGLPKALEKIISIINASGRVNISLVTVGFEKYDATLHNYYQAIYSITYELVNNVIKHAEATHALVQLLEHESSFILIVEDNGKGIGSIVGKNSLGLDGINSKIEYFKGVIAIDQNFPSGSIVTIEIPFVRYVV